VRIYGLTGNIAAGKSTVAALLRERGVPVIDADLVAREVVEPGRPALAEIAQLWPDVIASDGTLLRRALGAKIFADAEARARLNAIVHPRIAEEVARRLDALRSKGCPCAIYEAALIVENGLQGGLDGLILVTAPRDVQLQRLMTRDQSTREDALQRIASQLSEDEKRRHATFVVENAGDRAALQAQVDALLAKLNNPA
jgi:dephospho-CoA kinase